MPRRRRQIVTSDRTAARCPDPPLTPSHGHGHVVTACAILLLSGVLPRSAAFQMMPSTGPSQKNKSLLASRQGDGKSPSGDSLLELLLSDAGTTSSSQSLLSKPYASSLIREMDDKELKNVLASLEMENYVEEALSAVSSEGSSGSGSVGPTDFTRDSVDSSSSPGSSSGSGSGSGSSSSSSSSSSSTDPLWEQIKLEAETYLKSEPQAGPQLYSLILSQPSLIDAVATIISNEIDTELIPATFLKNLFLEQLTPEDRRAITLDIMAAALRSPSVGTAANSVLFNRGLHALVCYRVGHQLWQSGRTALAYYLQSTVSSKFSADIHPGARMGSGIYLNCGGGVVIGETTVVGDDVSILQGVTLGGTGKEAGDRHPKVGDGVILHDGATVLGNIAVGDGAVVTAKSIVTKPVPPLARVAGVPATVQSYREITDSHLYPDENALAKPVAGKAVDLT